MDLVTPEQRDEVARYIEQAKKVSEIERLSTVRERTGVFTGAHAVNPVNGEEIPIYVADYVLDTYGTGCVMAVPAMMNGTLTLPPAISFQSASHRLPGWGSRTALLCLRAVW